MEPESKCPYCEFDQSRNKIYRVRITTIAASPGDFQVYGSDPKDALIMALKMFSKHPGSFWGFNGADVYEGDEQYLPVVQVRDEVEHTPEGYVLNEQKYNEKRNHTKIDVKN